MRKLVLAAFCAASFGSSSFADSAAPTRGDAEAVFEAGPAGGGAILSHSGAREGAPSQGSASAGVAIRPFQSGLHVAYGWHPLLIAWIDPGPTGFTLRDAAADLGQIDQTFWLDGNVLPSLRTQVKPFLNQPFLDAAAEGDSEACGCTVTYPVGFAFQEGRVLGPEVLTAGDHHFRVRTTYLPAVSSDNPDGVVFENEITFTIDPP